VPRKEVRKRREKEARDRYEKVEKGGIR